MIRARRPHTFAATALLVVMLASTLGDATPEWTGVAREWQAQPRAAVAEDRYAMAGGCYAVKVHDLGYVVRDGDGYVVSATALETAEPFHFQATDLGMYLLMDHQGEFVSGSEGLLGEAVYGATRSTPGAIVGGVTVEQSDAAADALARSPLNEATGRGASVVSVSAASELSDWTVLSDGGGFFSIALAATNHELRAQASGLSLVRSNVDGLFSFELTDGCASFPEVEVNVEGPVLGGEASYQEVRGFMDLHLHMMAFEFLGGRARCGRPWHRYGVERALVDCPDHEPGGEGAVLEQVLSGPGVHDTDGWPTFEGWPRYNSLTHEQVYYKWMERAWRGGLRLFVNLLVDNHALCEIYPYKRNSCNEMDGVRLQADRIRELERYIDAQSGGPGEGWFRIVTDPFEARAVINEGKLAVVLGIEVSIPLDCAITLDIPACSPEQVDDRLDEIHAMGVRQMELVNKFDNAFSGVTGDAGATGIVVNQGNKRASGHYWRMETCGEADGDAHDKRQMNFSDDSGFPKQYTGRDSLVGAILGLFGTSGAAPLYPEGPHCNILGLSELGEQMIRGMAARGMIFDPDHMSARARTQAMDLVEQLGYSGVVSSHGWADDTIYPRVFELGGVVTPYAGGSEGFVSNWRQHKEWVEQLHEQWGEERYYFGFGYGADTNGFGSQGGPRGTATPNPVQYPFTGFGGTTISQQVSGTKTYDVNTAGVAHYGLYPDWLEDLRRQAGDEIIEDMARGPEAYLQMWERALGIALDACRSDVADLTDEQLAQVQPGMSPRQVVELLGQTRERSGATYAFCAADGRTATVTFSVDGAVTGVVVA